MEKIGAAFVQKDGTSSRADRFLLYQLYGPPGGDGIQGSADDLADPLIEDPAESLKVLEDRRRALTEKQNLTLKASLLRLLGRTTEADATAATARAEHLENIEDPSALKNDRVASLRTLMFALKKEVGDEPTHSLDAFDRTLRSRRERWRDLEKQAEKMALQYANDPQEIYIQDVWAEAAYHIGMLCESLGEPDAALAEYRKLTERGPSEDWKLYARFLMAHVYINSKREEEAGIQIYEDVISENRAGYNWLAGARFELADLAGRRGRPEEERRRLGEIVEKYPQSGWAKPANERLAQMR